MFWKWKYRLDVQSLAHGSYPSMRKVNRNRTSSEDVDHGPYLYILFINLYCLLFSSYLYIKDMKRSGSLLLLGGLLFTYLPESNCKVKKTGIGCLQSFALWDGCDNEFRVRCHSSVTFRYHWMIRSAAAGREWRWKKMKKAKESWTH